jgi:hypothetical protein
VRESTHRAIFTTISLAVFAFAVLLMLGELPLPKKVWFLAGVSSWGLVAAEIRRNIGED